MKTIFLAIVFTVFLSVYSEAQNNENYYEPRTLFSGGTKVTGWFFDFNNSYSEINGKHSHLPGFTGGIVMNRNFRMGLTGKSLSCYETYLKYNTLFDEPVYLVGGYGGFYFEASPIDDKVVHISFPLIIGGGGASYLTKERYHDYEEDDDDWDFDRNELSSSPFFIIEPGVNLEVNIISFMKLHSGFSYHWTNGLDLQKTSRSAFNSWSFNLGLMFGKF